MPKDYIFPALELDAARALVDYIGGRPSALDHHADAALARARDALVECLPAGPAPWSAPLLDVEVVLLGESGSKPGEAFMTTLSALSVGSYGLDVAGATTTSVQELKPPRMIHRVELKATRL